MTAHDLTPDTTDPITSQIARFLRDDAESPATRSKAGQAMVRRRWSRTAPADREKSTRQGRDAIWRRFLDAVPESVTDPVERERLAREARRAHMQALALVRTTRRAGKTRA